MYRIQRFRQDKWSTVVECRSLGIALDIARLLSTEEYPSRVVNAVTSDLFVSAVFVEGKEIPANEDWTTA